MTRFLIPIIKRKRAMQKFLGAVVAATAVLCGAASAEEDPVLQAAQQAERQLSARVGVAVLDSGTGRRWHYRADERFPMASTGKTLVCAALLGQGRSARNQSIQLRQSDILSYAPVTRELVGQSVSASELCAITMRTSDNTAVNAVLNVVGGPEAVTTFLRRIGDATTRLDRDEPTLNESTPGDPRDTTTPLAMQETLTALVLGTALNEESRSQLKAWLLSNEVGGPLLRAGLPQDWKVADRTGAGGYGTRGVAGIMWPPERPPIVAAIYLTETEATMDERNAAIAAIGQAIVTATTR